LILKNEILKEKIKEEPSFIAANIMDNYRIAIKKQIKNLKKNIKI